MNNDIWIERWNERYRQEDFAYGKMPNEYLKNQLASLSPGKALFPAEGEGRNSVYAASLGWSVDAFDISEEGQKKALLLAAQQQVSIHYKVGDLPELAYETESFDLIALIYAHFPGPVKSQYHRMLDRYLKKGGLIIFEAFSKQHLDYQAKNEGVGGPKDLATLFSEAEIRADFANYEILALQETEVLLAEGLYHRGLGSVIRFTGRKC